MEPLYGDDSRISFEDWSSRSSKLKNIAQVWYVPQYLRLLTFARSGVRSHEIDSFKFFCKTNEVDIGEE